MRIILLFSICVPLINARCPNPNELPRKYNSNTFMCARIYEHSNHVENLSCRGAYRNIYNGENAHSAPIYGWNDRVSSLVVREGCRLDVFWDHYFGGGHKQFTGKVHHLRNYGWNDAISSWSCACDFSNAALRCTPSEEYQQIAVCGNPNPGSATCTHSMQKGLSIGNSVTRGKSVSNTVEVSLGVTFKEIFSIGLAASTTTDYSWSRTDSLTFSKVRTTTISCEVLSGRTVRILQVVGRCGDTVVYTSHYICQ